MARIVEGCQWRARLADFQEGRKQIAFFFNTSENVIRSKRKRRNFNSSRRVAGYGEMGMETNPKPMVPFQMARI